MGWLICRRSRLLLLSMRLLGGSMLRRRLLCRFNGLCALDWWLLGGWHFSMLRWHWTQLNKTTTKNTRTWWQKRTFIMYSLMQESVFSWRIKFSSFITFLITCCVAVGFVTPTCKLNLSHLLTKQDLAYLLTRLDLLRSTHPSYNVCILPSWCTPI